MLPPDASAVASLLVPVAELTAMLPPDAPAVASASVPFEVALAALPPDASAVASASIPFEVALALLPPEASAVASASVPEAEPFALLGGVVAASQVASAPSELGPDVTSVLVVEHDSPLAANASVRATVRAIATTAIAAPIRTIRVCMDSPRGKDLADETRDQQLKHGIPQSGQRRAPPKAWTISSRVNCALMRR